MVYSVRVADPRNKFSASHFLFEHDKCSRLHGHNYHVAVELAGVVLSVAINRVAVIIFKDALEPVLL